MQQKTCEHIEQSELKTPGKVCDECVKTGQEWVHLRTCLTCGTTLCCDSSPGKHMTAHYRSSGHPVMMSAEPGEKWKWCFPHELFVRY